MAQDAIARIEARSGKLVTEFSPLQNEIRKLIKSSGPMPVWRYMELCLLHPQHGYYVSRDPLGREGDFTTSPEVSQMFGELLGLWAASVWRAIGSPPMLRLVELGPGRGTMMADALRALRVLPPLYQSLTIHMVEINPVLREKQRATLSGVRNISWHDSIDDIVEGPAVIFANEYFDVLPIRQMVKRETGWHERVVDLDANGKLMFARRRRADAALRGAAAAAGARCAGRRRVRMAARYRDHEDRDPRAQPGRRGADHRLRPSAQRCRRHFSGHRPPQLYRSAEKSWPGRRDSACRFPGTGARGGGSRCARAGPVTQGDFLKRLGIESRAATLMAKATHEVSEDISGALKRLTEPGRGGMGSMFKVLGVSQPDVVSLAGLSDEEPDEKARSS